MMSNKFNIGDRIAVLDDNLEGNITYINNGVITIEDEDGFELQFSETEIVRIGKPQYKIETNHVDFEEILKEKSTPKKNIKQRIKPKQRNAPAMEVDLHIHKLTKSERGLSSYDKLNLQVDTAKRKLDFAIHKRIQKIVFIHGVGEGVLKAELETMLRRYDNLKYYDADYKTYGLGATEVYIYQNS
jgi:dsDNA-specific endonuclease/ATPase MutS2